MSESGETRLRETPYPQQRTAEQHAAVRRKSLPIAVGGAICGVAGIVWLLLSPIGLNQPPQIIAVNLSFCAMMMGVGILFYAKGTSGTKWAAWVCVLAILTGLVGPMIYTKQSVNFRIMREGQELENVRQIALAARKYAQEHQGKYPEDIALLLTEKYLSPEQVHSCFGSEETTEAKTKVAKQQLSPAEFDSWFAGHSDYDYFGNGLKLESLDPATSEVMIVACGHEPIMRVNMVMSFADGSRRFVTLDDIVEAQKKCNKVRAKLGLPPLETPAAVERARQNEQGG